MIFRMQAGPAALASIDNLTITPFWLDQPIRPAARPVLGSNTSDPLDADLVVVGGGFTGLWTALLAKERDPGRDVVLLEGGRIADGATGRNGGFVSASLTHGLANGLDRFPGELPTLLSMGHENLDGIEQAIARYGIDCAFVRTGEIDVAVAPHQVPALCELVDAGQVLGEDFVFLDASEVQARVMSPSYLGGLWDRRGVALVDPARLAWGLAAACERAGVRVHEHSPVTRADDQGDGVLVVTPLASIKARRVALATNAYPPLLKRLRSYVVPVYDYVLVTEPLSAQQWESIGWSGREGLSDAGNQFHYYRVTEDGRILWGGFDAVHHAFPEFARRYEDDPSCFAHLAEHFLQTFPALEGIRFTHGWGGAIDTCSRFSAFWGRAMAGKMGYVVGYTGLGVGASRFGAATMLDLIDGLDTPRTRLDMVRSKPLPFPPEPLRSIGIEITTKSLAAADAKGGRRNAWLRTLDAVGLGFDS